MSWLSPSLKLENLLAEATMDPEDETEAKSYEKRDVVAEWRVPVHGKLHRVEFEHGTTSGKRVIWVNGMEVLRRDWMFKLVGEDFFAIEDVRCIIRVNPAAGFKYNYLLFVDGKPFKQFTEQQAKALKTWVTTLNGKEYRTVLERDSLNIFLNGNLRDEMGEFVEDGTDTHFTEDGHHFYLSARGSGNKREGIIHSLMVDGLPIPEEHFAE